LFAEITKNRVLLVLIDKRNLEGRIPKWKAVESHLALICLRMVREKPGTSTCCMDADWYQGSVKVLRQSAVGRLVQTGEEQAR